MKQASWLAILIFAALLSQSAKSRAQIAIYGTATADYLNSGPYTDFVEGGSAGLVVDLKQGWHDRITFSADL